MDGKGPEAGGMEPGHLQGLPHLLCRAQFSVPVISAATPLRLGLVCSQLKSSQALRSPCIAVKPDCARHHLWEFIFAFAVLLDAIETQLPMGGKFFFLIENDRNVGTSLDKHKE